MKRRLGRRQNSEWGGRGRNMGDVAGELLRTQEEVFRLLSLLGEIRRDAVKRALRPSLWTFLSILDGKKDNKMTEVVNYFRLPPLQSRNPSFCRRRRRP